uniref:Gag-pol polyprotein n=1 Tax=Solanum tuberosum TaxID=4113 RepID=M1D7Z8_SOLTU
MVADMSSRMSLFVVRLIRLSSKESKATMLINDMGIARLMIHVQQVEEDHLKDREEFKNKRAKTSGNESEQKKSNANWSSFQRACGEGNCLYAITSRREQENSADVVTGLI